MKNANKKKINDELNELMQIRHNLRGLQYWLWDAMICDGGDDEIAYMNNAKLLKCIKYVANYKGINNLQNELDKELHFNLEIYEIAISTFIANDLLKDILKNNELNDKREYDIADLISAYNINDAIAKGLFNLIYEESHK